MEVVIVDEESGSLQQDPGLVSVGHVITSVFWNNDGGIGSFDEQLEKNRFACYQ